MTKFTPGPWKYDETWSLITADNGAVEVAACHAGRGADSQANALLIAAAPDLYNALDSLIKCCELNLDDMEEETHAAIDKAINALKKAQNVDEEAAIKHKLWNGFDKGKVKKGKRKTLHTEKINGVTVKVTLDWEGWFESFAGRKQCISVDGGEFFSNPMEALNLARSKARGK